ncbi:YcbK family protein [Phyllobacterium pellucidum]|nr:YcbK family protein [Phyllobacterium pellucidum]
MKILPASVSALRASTVACVVALSAFAATSCTTGTSPSVTSALTSAAESTQTAEAKSTSEHGMPSTGTATVSPEALALAGNTEANALQAMKDATKPADAKAAAAVASTEQQAAATAPVEAAPQQKTSLFGSSAPAKPEGTLDVASAAAAAAPAKTSLFGNSMRGEGAPAPQKAAPKPAEAAEAPASAETAKPDEAAANADVKPAETKAAAATAPNKDSGLLLRLFGNSQNRPAASRQVAIIQPRSQPQLRSAEPPVQTASAALPSAESFEGKTEHLSSLPGVRPNAGIQIMQRDSLYEDDDVEAAPAQVILASAAGLARLAPNGLKVQRENVQVACLKPQLVGFLKSIERRFGKAVIVTSGYRSPPYNRLVNGAKASLHMSCAAADIQVPGVSKWVLANFARSMPGRGGVGTYCHTESVHVDIGPTRDWNWRCSRGRG